MTSWRLWCHGVWLWRPGSDCDVLRSYSDVRSVLLPILLPNFWSCWSCCPIFDLVDHVVPMILPIIFDLADHVAQFLILLIMLIQWSTWVFTDGVSLGVVTVVHYIFTLGVVLFASVLWLVMVWHIASPDVFSSVHMVPLVVQVYISWI